jgi:hypothetical protein
MWSCVGFLPLSLLRRRGNDEPKVQRSQEPQRLSRLDGSEIQVEFYGSPEATPLICRSRLIVQRLSTPFPLLKFLLR